MIAAYHPELSYLFLVAAFLVLLVVSSLAEAVRRLWKRWR
jgi:hypothetical protein